MTYATQMDVSGIRPLIADLGRMEPEVRKTLRRGLRDAGGHAAARAKANASWSRRIPRAITVRPLTGSRTGGVFLRTNANVAPHARPYEGISKRGSGARTFRHPVFGNREKWVAVPTRPFLQPARDATRPEVFKAAEEAVLAAARAGRFT